MSAILIIDDETGIRLTLASILEDEKYKVFTAEDALAGIEILKREFIDLVFLDVLLPKMGGIEALEKIKKGWPALEMVMISGHANIDMAVRAVKLGAFEFLEKPLSLDKVLTVCRNALAIKNLKEENKTLKKISKFSSDDIIGTSVIIRNIREMVKQAADSDARILITGENGSGKEVIARAIHHCSARCDNPFVDVNCAAIPETLIESELFGHEKGAFTGALARRRGRFELANEGTLFLDEIGEIEQNIQIKLLRVLQERKFERVGGEETIETDVRIIAATNRDLKAEIEKGAFREDLYFRLNVVNIRVPPLRERKEDIPLLLNAFLGEFSRENGKQIEGFDEKARAAVYNYDWPGNVRELRNCVESAVVMVKGNVITQADLPPTVSLRKDDKWIRIPLGTNMEESERIVIQNTLDFFKGNKSKAADVLGIGRKTLHRKLGGDDSVDADD